MARFHVEPTASPSFASSWSDDARFVPRGAWLVAALRRLRCARLGWLELLSVGATSLLGAAAAPSRATRPK